MPEVREPDIMVSDYEVDVDPEDLAAIDEGLQSMKDGRMYTHEEVKGLVRQWSTGSSTPLPR